MIEADRLKEGLSRNVVGGNAYFDLIDNALTVEAIPKDQYEARLKADMVAMLDDLKKEMNPIKECEYQIYGKEHWGFVGKCQDVIQQKIDKLKENLKWNG